MPSVVIVLPALTGPRVLLFPLERRGDLSLTEAGNAAFDRLPRETLDGYDCSEYLAAIDGELNTRS